MTNKIYNIRKCDSEELVGDIFQYLDNIEKESTKTPKYHFNGEGDSQQTKYERLGNILKICVVAKEEKVARCLHQFLRIIIDKRNLDEILNIGSLIFSETKKLTVEQIVDLMACDVDSYFHTHDLKDGMMITTFLGNDEIVRRYIGDISCWSLYRIADSLGLEVEIEEFPDVK